MISEQVNKVISEQVKKMISEEVKKMISEEYNARSAKFSLALDETACGLT